MSWLLAHLQKSNTLSSTSRDSLLSVLTEHQPPSQNIKQIPLQDNALFKTFTEGVALADIQPELYIDYLKSSRLLSRALKVAPGETAFLVNGRVSATVFRQMLPRLTSRYHSYPRTGCWPHQFFQGLPCARLQGARGI